MNDLFPYIDKELQYIRALAGELAARNPRLSSRLELGGTGQSSDPHVERLLETFAMLTGRIRRKLDDELPEISDALLNALYPHYLAPIPSMSIVQFKLSAAEASQVNGFPIPSNSELESEDTPFGPCTYRTCSSVRIWPIDVTAAVLQQRRTQLSGANRDSSGLLRITLNCLGPGKVFSALKLQKLRFHISGQDHYVFGLYELIVNGLLDVSVSNHADGSSPRFLGAGVLAPAGFDAADAIVPPEPRTFPGYRLLSEYFSFPRKFLFFDVDLSRVSLAEIGPTLTLQFHLEHTSTEIEPHVNAGTFKLGCTPIVNLFSKNAEPFEVTQTRTEYPVEVYSAQNQSYEVYKIDSKVTAVSGEGKGVDYHPFYSDRHATADQRFWCAARRPAMRDGRPAPGTDMFLSLVDLKFSTSNPVGWTLQPKVTCTNRDLPKLLPGGEGRPRFTLVASKLPSIHTLVSPTAPLPPDLGRGAIWGLISHLMLNHLSLCDSAAGPDALTGDAPPPASAIKEILHLYNFNKSPETRAKIDSILSFSSQRATARAGGAAAGGFCHGIKINIHFDESGFPNKDVFLFASVLERFVGMYASINSFCQLVAFTKQRNGELKKWPPRAGLMTLL